MITDQTLQINMGMSTLGTPTTVGDGEDLTWESLLPGVWRFRDSCNVYAVRGPSGLLIINVGQVAEALMTV